LVKAEPGVDIKVLRQHIQQRVPELLVLDKMTYCRRCMYFWLTRTGLGISFSLSAVLGLFVGLGVVAQTMYGAVMERAREFATLKALGADSRHMYRFLFMQTFGCTCLGAGLGLILAWGTGWLLTSPRAPVEFNWQIPVLSILFVTASCWFATWLPYLRFRQLDPAEVLRS
jgi:putative ABC transport system permease protein